MSVARHVPQGSAASLRDSKVGKHITLRLQIVFVVVRWLGIPRFPRGRSCVVAAHRFCTRAGRVCTCHGSFLLHCHSRSQSQPSLWYHSIRLRDTVGWWIDFQIGCCGFQLWFSCFNIVSDWRLYFQNGFKLVSLVSDWFKSGFRFFLVSVVDLTPPGGVFMVKHRCKKCHWMMNVLKIPMRMSMPCRECHKTH